ncbi:hypothetical protein C362_05431 [Cryptococcus neoformans Bt1]|nr:hypothetical protein C362_05431 [Cryptococcus neoformans var. grubii Bt1]
MDRRKDPARIFYPHGWRELVNGSLEEGFAPIALATIGNLTTEYYVPQNEHLQFLLYLAINPYDHGLTSYEPFAVLYRLLKLHNPRLFAGGIPSHSSAFLYRAPPLSSSTNNGDVSGGRGGKSSHRQDTFEHPQDDAPSWLTWEKGRSLLHRNVYKYMKRCKDQGIWPLLWTDPAKENRVAGRARRARKTRDGLGVKEEYKEAKRSQSPRKYDDDDDGDRPPENVIDAELDIDLDLEQELEHDNERERPPTPQGWLLLEWLVAVWEKDEMLRRGQYQNPQLEWSPIFLRQLARPYDRTGQMQWSDAGMVMGILKAAFAEPFPDEDEDEDEEEEENEGMVDIEEDEEIGAAREEAKIAEKLKREEGKEMLARKRSIAVRLFRLLLDTAIAPLPPPPSSNPPSRPPSSSPGPEAGAFTSPFLSSPGIGTGTNTAAPTPPTPMSNRSSPSRLAPSVHPPFNPPSLTSSLIRTLAPLPISSLQFFLMLLIPSPFPSPCPSFSLSHGTDINALPAAVDTTSTTLPPVPLAPITHIITLLLEHFAGTSRRKGEERRERRRRRLPELDFEPGYNGLGRPTVGYLCREVLALIPPLPAPASKGTNRRTKKGKSVQAKVKVEKGMEEEGQDEKVEMKMAHLKLVLLQILLRQERNGEKPYSSKHVELETLRREKIWRRDVETSFLVSETRSHEDPEGSTALLRVGRMVLLSVDRVVGI